MTEEEAIKICKNIIRSINGETCFLGYSKEQDKEAIETLLELYNKQKEENKKDIKGYSKMINSLEEQLAHKTKEIKELNSEFALNAEIHKRDEEIKELKDTIKCLHEPAENYISKDKIREKIKQLEHTYQSEEEENGYNDETYMYYIPQIKVLKQMLGEL